MKIMRYILSLLVCILSLFPKETSKKLQSHEETKKQLTLAVPAARIPDEKQQDFLRSQKKETLLTKLAVIIALESLFNGKAKIDPAKLTESENFFKNEEKILKADLGAGIEETKKMYKNIREIIDKSNQKTSVSQENLGLADFAKAPTSITINFLYDRYKKFFDEMDIPDRSDLEKQITEALSDQHKINQLFERYLFEKNLGSWKTSVLLGEFGSTPAIKKFYKILMHLKRICLVWLDQKKQSAPPPPITWLGRMKQNLMQNIKDPRFWAFELGGLGLLYLGNYLGKKGYQHWQANKEAEKTGIHEAGHAAETKASGGKLIKMSASKKYHSFLPFCERSAGGMCEGGKGSDEALRIDLAGIAAEEALSGKPKLYYGEEGAEELINWKPEYPGHESRVKNINALKLKLTLAQGHDIQRAHAHSLMDVIGTVDLYEKLDIPITLIRHLEEHHPHDTAFHEKVFNNAIKLNLMKLYPEHTITPEIIDFMKTTANTAVNNEFKTKIESQFYRTIVNEIAPLHMKNTYRKLVKDSAKRMPLLKDLQKELAKQKTQKTVSGENEQKVAEYEKSLKQNLLRSDIPENTAQDVAQLATKQYRNNLEQQIRENIYTQELTGEQMEPVFEKHKKLLEVS